MLSNAGDECYSTCNNTQGLCSWCGSEGMCCTQKVDWNDTGNGCDGNFGGQTRHECVLKPGIFMETFISCH